MVAAPGKEPDSAEIKQEVSGKTLEKASASGTRAGAPPSGVKIR
jgi:hypothetical protein